MYTIYSNNATPPRPIRTDASATRDSDFRDPDPRPGFGGRIGGPESSSEYESLSNSGAGSNDSGVTLNDSTAQQSIVGPTIQYQYNAEWRYGPTICPAPELLRANPTRYDHTHMRPDTQSSVGSESSVRRVFRVFGRTRRSIRVYIRVYICVYICAYITLAHDGPAYAHAQAPAAMPCPALRGAAFKETRSAHW